MAKKKSKKKHKKEKGTKKKDSQISSALDQSNIKNLGIMFASLLIGQIVESAIERLLQKNSSPTTSTSVPETPQNGSEATTLSHSIPHPVASSVLTLDQESGASQLELKDVVEAVRVAVQEMTPTLDDVVHELKTSAWQSVQQAVRTAETKTGIAVKGAVSSAKSLMENLNPNETSILNKPSKKKHKKNKKK